MKYKIPSEFKITRLRECPGTTLADKPENCLAYWNQNITTAEWFDQDRECVVTLLANARLRVIGHHLISIGSLTECTIHPREVLRPAIMHSAFATILMHNHPSGDPSPSAADHRVTKRLRDASQILQINLLDHVIAGSREPIDRVPYYSFCEAGIL